MNRLFFLSCLVVISSGYFTFHKTTSLRHSKREFKQHGKLLKLGVDTLLSKDFGDYTNGHKLSDIKKIKKDFKYCRRLERLKRRNQRLIINLNKRIERHPNFRVILDYARKDRDSIINLEKLTQGSHKSCNCN